MNYSNEEIREEDIRDENELVNIIAGMSYPVEGFPKLLYELSYNLEGFEVKFRNNQDREVKPDIVIGSDNKGILILFEAKSGKNVEDEQIENYSNIKKDDLIDNALFGESLLRNGHDIAYVCYENTFVTDQETGITKKLKGFDNIIKGIKGKYNFPVLVFDKDRSILSLNFENFKDKHLTDELSKEIKIPNTIPNIINFDHHSPKSEIAEEIIRNISSYRLQEKSEFTIEEILHDILSPYPDIVHLIPSDVQVAVKRKVIKLLPFISKKTSYIEWVKPRWIINDKFNLHPSQLKSLENLIVELKKLENSKENNQGQLSLKFQ